MNSEDDNKKWTSRQSKPLPNYRSARLVIGKETAEDIAHFTAVLRRNQEAAELKRIFGILEIPELIDGKKLSDSDEQSFLLAVNYARDTAREPEQFLRLVVLAVKKPSARFFRVCAVAMEAVKAERRRRYSHSDGHRMAALQAKLEIERDTGELPTQLRVKQRASEIVDEFIRTHRQDFAPLEPENKQWSKILKSVGLDYLPRAIKGRK